MIKSFKAVALGSSLLLANVSVCSAQDLQKGFAAYSAKDFATALREWRPLAAQGNANAQNNLGAMYANGLGVTQDYKEAVRLFGLAAAQGDANAQNNLGAMYANGLGVTQDYKEAVRLYGLAAEQGNANAQNNLVSLGESNAEVKAAVAQMQDLQKGLAAYKAKDYATALKEWRPLAAQGNARAQNLLGMMYYSGTGVAQDYKEAVRLYGLAAAQGDANAQNNLGAMYHNGTGVAQDYNEAARLFGLAAAQGSATGRANVVTVEAAVATQAAEALAKTRELAADEEAEKQSKIQQEAEAQVQVKDAAECKSFGAAVGSPAYVQCRISLKALRQGVLENQQKAAQDNARADELKAQSEQQQRQATAQQAAAERAAAVQTDILDAMERRQDDANNAALLKGLLDGLNRNKPKLRCTTSGSDTTCY